MSTTSAADQQTLSMESGIEAAGAGSTPAMDLIVPTRAEVNEAKSNGNSTAQSTLDRNFGSPEIEGLPSSGAGTSSDSVNTTDTHKGEKPLSAMLLHDAAERGTLTDTLKKAGVDTTNPKAVEAYLTKSFDNNTSEGIRFHGVALPENPTDEDFGKATLPFIHGSNEMELKAKLESDPAAGYKFMRDTFLTRQTEALRQEAAPRH